MGTTPPESSSWSTSEDIPTSVRGQTHRRFVFVSTLLSLIDPVRGEPTTHSLDRHPHDDSWRLEQLQKKFLDSFALICSTSTKGAGTASAVCLEQGHPSGTILRLARNRGVPEDLVGSLQEVLEDLTAVALRERMASDAESDILYKIISLNHDKIRYLLGKLSRPDIRITIDDAIRKVDEKKMDPDDAVEANFRQWFHNLPRIAYLNLDSGSADLIHHIQWASQARWVFANQLETLLGDDDGELPLWLKHIYKLGRYYAAAKAMLKLARKDAAVFTRIRVETVQAPKQVEFSVGNEETPLLTALKKVTSTDPEALMVKLGQTWLTDDPESRLRQACRMTLTVHAEMQLLSFYDHNPHLTPRLLFMGTSKKACYLCHEFMSRHPLSIGVSASHQKLYPSWMPAPCSSAVRKKHKVLLWEFSRHLEETTARDLETRLDTPGRRTGRIPMDSTAGPSLTTTGSISVGSWDRELPLSALGRDETAGSNILEIL